MAKQSCTLNVTINILNGVDSNGCNEACPLECDFIEYRLRLFKNNYVFIRYYFKYFFNFSTSRATYPTKYYMGLYSNHTKVIASGIPTSDLNRALIPVNTFPFGDL
jgi:hypothetical protein